MSTSRIIGEEIDKHAALATAALRNICAVGAGTSAKQLLPRAVLDMLWAVPGSAFLCGACRAIRPVQRGTGQALHSKLLPLERMADDMLAAARQRGYFDDPDIAEPLHWLETCNEQVKDCMVALESMLDPQLDDLMATALEEHQRGEAVPLDSIR